MKNRKLQLSTLLTLALGLTVSGQAQLVNGMVPAGTPINNQAFLEGTQGDSTQSFTASSNVVNVTVTEVNGVMVEIGGRDATEPSDPGQTVKVSAGGTGELAFVVTNTGNAEATYTINLTPVSGTLTSLSFWVDTDTDGIIDSGETFASGETITLPAGENITVTVLGQLPAGSLGTEEYIVQFEAADTAGGVSDSDNFGAFDTQDVIGATLNANTVSTIRPGQSVTFTKTLTNTGNINADLNNLSFSFTEADTKEIVTFTYQFAGAGAFATLQEAWEDSFSISGALAPNQSRSLTVTAQAISSSSTVATTDVYSVTNTAELSAGPDTQSLPEDSDTTTLTPAVYSASPMKLQTVCTPNASSFTCQTETDEPVSPQPCDVLIYRIVVDSDPVAGSALRRPVMRDDISPLNQPLYARSYMSTSRSNMNAGNFSAGLVSLDNATWNSTINSFGTSTTVWAGYNNVADGTMTTADFMTAGNVLELEVAAQVKGNNCRVFNKATAGNYPAFPFRTVIVSPN